MNVNTTYQIMTFNIVLYIVPIVPFVPRFCTRNYFWILLLMLDLFSLQPRFKIFARKLRNKWITGTLLTFQRLTGPNRRTLQAIIGHCTKQHETVKLDTYGIIYI